MPSLSQQRCFNHGTREPVARCPECRHYFCRECISEHDSRILCASCISKLTQVKTPSRSGRGSWTLLLATLAGTCLVIVVFYSAGRFMLSIPANYHEGTVWKVSRFWEK